MQRDQNRGGGFLLGTLIGIIAGVAGGVVLLRRAQRDDTSATLRYERDAAEDHAEAGAARIADRAQRLESRTQDRVQEFFGSLRSRWQEALSEGRRAASDRQRGLQAQLAATTKQLPEFEAELLD